MSSEDARARLRMPGFAPDVTVMPPTGGLATGLIDELRRRLRVQLHQTVGPHRPAAADPAVHCKQIDISMHTTRSNSYQDVRPARGERHGNLATRPPAVSPRPPVLPRGWAPLTGDQQRAVLEACDQSPDAMVFRIASAADSQTEYRVYRLENESWAGLWLATECWTDCDGLVTNRLLLGLGTDAPVVIRIALEVVNRDLEARGESCRLGVGLAVATADPRRI